MKALPVIVAVVAVVAAIRLGLHRRGQGPPRRTGAARARLGGGGLFGGTGLVAGREIRERVVTVILFGVVAAAVIIPTLGDGGADQAPVLGPRPAGSAPRSALTSRAEPSISVNKKVTASALGC